MAGMGFGGRAYPAVLEGSTDELCQCETTLCVFASYWLHQRPQLESSRGKPERCSFLTRSYGVQFRRAPFLLEGAQSPLRSCEPFRTL
jgi:hypothetical protein